ncbi:30S ribosomal protein S17 [Candidatus Woesearchaeota archaeon]|nr:30S ribosomal protein S17 [Candidatus Woesearchaeota archaeon]
MKGKNIGLGLEAPKEECTDKKCPFHGEISIKSETFVGKVIKKDVSRTATIEWGRNVYVKKYERYAKKRSRLRAHNPPCLKVEIGDEVMVARTRPLSKTKHYVIVKMIKKIEEAKKPEVSEK